MKSFSTLKVLMLVGVTAAPAMAGPITGEEAQRQTRALDGLKKAIASETTNAAKFTHIASAMKDEPDPNLRRAFLLTAVQIPGADLENFLTGLLTSEEDAELRSQAATTLGRIGSEKCLVALAQTAGNDRTTSIQIADIGSKSSARRAATFAIGELGVRFPKLADDAAKSLRALKVADDVKDNEGLADARVQALFQITHDETLIKPFYERLKSKDVQERESGVVAFRFLKLSAAPAELVSALKDSNTEVRSWSALVLGEIGDAKTSPALMTAAGDLKEDNSVRCNAIVSLGRMKTAAAADLMEKLLMDPSGSVQANAAIALYRITGKKVKQLPEGFRAD